MSYYRVGLATLILNLWLNWFFYPDLLRYQSSDQAAFYINEKYPGVPGVRLGIYAPAFEFYLTDTLLKADSSAVIVPDKTRSGIWYVTEQELDFIKQSGTRYEIIKELKEFHVTTLSLKFVNKKTRSKELKKYFLVKLL